MLISLSDLHLSHGDLDDFDNDSYLVEFLADVGKVFDLKEKSKEKKNVLVLNGDFMDVLESKGDSYVDKVAGIRKAHGKVFRALNKLAQKHEVVYVRGNHDWDAFRTKNLPVTKALFPNVKVWGRRVYTCRYRDPQNRKIVIHVEHGNQYDSFNEFFYDDPGNEENALGSVIVTNVIDILEPVFPNIDSLVMSDLFEMLKEKLSDVLDEYDLKNVKSGNNSPGIFSRINRKLKCAVHEQKGEMKIKSIVLAMELLTSILGKFNGFEDAARKIAIETTDSSIIIFGHTHDEKTVPLEGANLYFNDGTWTKKIKYHEGDFYEDNSRSYIAVNFNRTLHQNQNDALRRYNGKI